MCIKHKSCRYWTYATDLKKCWLKSKLTKVLLYKPERVSGHIPGTRPAKCEPRRGLGLGSVQILSVSQVRE